MRVGTKSILFGVHQFILHPLLVLLAWGKLYGFPLDVRIWVCIGLHDLGYVGKAEMDSAEGERHVEWGAWVAGVLFGRSWYEFCLGHSRHYARKEKMPVSKLCFADKLAITLYPTWLYLVLARASGELKEYRSIAAKTGHVSLRRSDREWKQWLDDRMLDLVTAQRPDAAPYVNAT